MNRIDLERHLRAQGCVFDHHGGSHDIWWNPRNEAQAPVPRHRHVKRGTVRNICRLLGVSRPPGI